MNWIAERNEKVRELKKYCDALEQQRDYLLQALRNQAAGIVSSDCHESWNYPTKLQFTAATYLQVTITKYPVPLIKPWCWWV